MADAGSGAGLPHLLAEGLGTAMALGGAAWFFRSHLADQREARAWREQAQELLAGSDRPCSASSRPGRCPKPRAEVALLLLKGLSFKEVAQVRQTSERTAREQARAVYKKAHVAGRAELAAWFIEDLLPPTS